MHTHRYKNPAWALLSIMLLLLTSTVAYAQSSEAGSLIVSSTGPYTSILEALDAAQDGDVIEVQGGTYPGGLVISKSVSLIGTDLPVIDGEGEGTVVIVTAPNVVLTGFIVRNSGKDVNHEDSGIVVQADGVRVENNTFQDVLFGIYFADADNGLVLNNTVVGYDIDLPLRGDGIRVWYSVNVLIENNEVTSTRDTLIWFANEVTIRNNYFHSNRYGLHFMYSDNAVVENNRFTNNSVGTYLMHSSGLEMNGNYLSYNRGPSGYGLALKDMDIVNANDNWIVGNRSGLYIDNSPSAYDGYNYFNGNVFAYNDLGVTVLPNVSRNVFAENSFMENIQQVGTHGRGTLQGNVWTDQGLGNYWSDYVGFDADGDQVGDVSYRSEKLFENLTDEYPQLRFFLYSPASQAIDFAASAFPSLRPQPNLVDDAPLMQAPVPEMNFVTEAEPAESLLLVSAFLVLGGVAVCIYAMRYAIPGSQKKLGFE